MKKYEMKTDRICKLIKYLDKMLKMPAHGNLYNKLSLPICDQFLRCLVNKSVIASWASDKQ